MALVSKKDLNAASKADLEKLAADVADAIANTAKKSMNAARKAAEKAAAEHGFSLSELSGGEAPKKRGRPAKAKKAGRKPAKKAAAPAKYRNPDDASQTWSGRGRQPAWYKSGIEAGKSPDDFAI